MLRFGVLALVLQASACGDSPIAGPSPVAPPVPQVLTVAAAGAPMPDPAYLRMLVAFDRDGRAQRWEGGPMHHCFGEGLRAKLDAVADRVTALARETRTEAGPCNVEWIIGDTPDTERKAYTGIPESGPIRFARVVFVPPGLVDYFPRDYFVQPGIALHEGGHVLGLRHSSVPGDLMNPDTNGDRDFSARELPVLAWMYGR